MRSKLKQVQKEFGEIVHELDGQDFHVVWPSKKQVLSFPLLITNEEKTQDNNSLSLHDENDNNHVEPGGVDEDRTLTQDVCDKIDDISALYPSTDNQETLARDTSEIPGNFVSDSVKRKLEQNFDETFLGEEKKPTHTVKTGSIDNNMNHPGLGEDNEIRTQQGHEIMTSDSPHPDDKQMYTQHSTPVSSGDTETTDRVTSRRHPLLTDSWMTDKSFGKPYYTFTLLLHLFQKTTDIFLPPLISKLQLYRCMDMYNE